MGDEAEAALHGLGAPGAVEDMVEEFSPADVAEPGLVPLPQPHGMGHAQRRRGKVQAVVAPVDHRHLRTLELCEDATPTADGAEPTTSARWPGPHLGAGHRMSADRQELDHRRLIEADALGLEEMRFGQAQILAHAAVDMHAQHFERCAAIGAPTRQAMQCPQWR